MSRTAAIVCLLFTVLLWSTGGFLIKKIAWPALGIVGIRSLIAGVLLWFVFPKKQFTFSKFQIGGALAYAITVFLFVLATKWTTAANAIVLQYTAPLYIAIFASWFLGEKTQTMDWVLVIVALFGMFLFFYDDLSTRNLYGNIFGVLSGITFAWLVLFLRKQRSGSNIESVILGNFIAAFACLPVIGELSFDASNIGYILVLGIFQMALAYYLFSIAIKHLQALEAIVIQLIEPIINPLWVFLFIGEMPGKMATMGAMIVLSAVLFRAIMPILKRKLA